MRDTLGPVSAALAADLQDLTRQHGFVVWPDRPGAFTDFVDRLVRRRDTGELPFDLVAYRGSFLELMLELEPRVGGLAKRPLLIHLPGFDEAAARDTPLLELLCDGYCFRKLLADVVADAAVEKVPPGPIAELVARDDLTLDEADAWLALRLAGQQAGELGRLHALRLPDVVDDLLRPRGVFTELASEREGPLWQYLSARSGVNAAWRDACIPRDPVRAEDLAFAVASWALSVEYVHDLKHREPTDERLRVMDALPRPVIEACRELAAHLRDRPDDFYRRTADETERLLSDEVKAAKAEDLGKVDTFRFEEDKVLTAAPPRSPKAPGTPTLEWAELRATRSPALRRSGSRIDPSRPLAWELVRAATSPAIGRRATRPPRAPPRRARQPRDGGRRLRAAHGAAVDARTATSSTQRGPCCTRTPDFETCASASTSCACAGAPGPTPGPWTSTPSAGPRLSPRARAPAAHPVRGRRAAHDPGDRAPPRTSWWTRCASRWASSSFASSTGTGHHGPPEAPASRSCRPSPRWA
jgi:hypothetical protein